MDSRRFIDLVLTVPAAPAAAVLTAALAALVKLSSEGPAFYVQRRVGRRRRPFGVIKLRTMVDGAASLGPAITAARDPRITPLGRILRRTKLDELPQLWNVLKGEMSLVGPRPEVERYVARYRPEWLEVLEARPGLTDSASLAFRDEEALLALAEDRERAYLEVLLPAKMALALDGVRRRSALGDLFAIVQTVLLVTGLRRAEHPAVQRCREAILALNRASHPSPVPSERVASGGARIVAASEP